MGLNDLIRSTEASSPSSGLGIHMTNYELQNQVLPLVLSLLKDANSEVQTLAVQCLVELVKHSRSSLETVVGASQNKSSERDADVLLGMIVAKLLEIISVPSDKKSIDDGVYDLSLLGLKGIIAEVGNSRSLFSRKLLDFIAVKKMFPAISQILLKLHDPSLPLKSSNKDDHIMELLEILSQCILLFGDNLWESSDEGKLVQQIQEVLFSFLSHTRGGVRKRASTGIGRLASLISCRSTNLLHKLLDGMVDQLSSLIDKYTRNTAAATFSDTDTLGSHVSCISWTFRCVSEADRKEMHGLRSKKSTISEYSETVVRKMFELMDTSSSGADEYDFSEHGARRNELRELAIQCLETLCVQLPDDMSFFIEEIRDKSFELIAYDPNYAYDEDDDDVFQEIGDGGRMDDLSGEADDETDEYIDSEEDYVGDIEDDEDLSWRIRKQSAKLLKSLIENVLAISGNLADLEKFFGEPGLNRILSRLYQEREETVVEEIFSCLQIFIIRCNKKTDSLKESPTKIPTGRRGSDNSINGRKRKQDEKDSSDVHEMEVEENVRLQELLYRNIIKISTVLSKSWRKHQQMVSVKHKVLYTLTLFMKSFKDVEPIDANDWWFAGEILKFIPLFEYCLGSEELNDSRMPTSTNFSIELLVFLRSVYTFPLSKFLKLESTQKIVVAVSHCLHRETHHKCKHEALVLLDEIFKNLSKCDEFKINSQLAESIIQIIHDAVLPIFKDPSFDSAVKDSAIICISDMYYSFGNLFPVEEFSEVLIPTLIARIMSQSTRITALIKLNELCNSEYFTQLNQAESLAQLSPILVEVSGYLKNDARDLRFASTKLLKTLVNFYEAGSLDQNDLYVILDTLADSLNDVNDLPILANELDLLAQFWEKGHNILDVREKVDSIFSVKVFPTLPKILLEPQISGKLGSKVVSSICHLIETSVSIDLKNGDNIEKLLLKPFNSSEVPFNSIKCLAKCYASLLTCQESNNIGAIAHKLFTLLKNKRNKSLPLEKFDLMALRTLGYFSKSYTDNNDLTELQELFIGIIYEFKSLGDDACTTSAHSLGQLIAYNMESKFQDLIQYFKTAAQNANCHYYLVIVVNEIISENPKELGNNPSYCSELWNLLFETQAVILEAEQKDSSLSLMAEGIGKIAQMKPDVYLPKLLDTLKAPNPWTRVSVLSAFGFTLTTGNELNHFDKLIKPVIPEFLALLSSDADLNVRRHALFSLNTALHSKPNLVEPHLSTLVPLIMGETRVKEDLIKVVDMGPFKHKVDSGLDARKAAYECLFSLLNSSVFSSSVVPKEYLEQIVRGLNDPAQEVQLVALMMLQKICTDWNIWGQGVIVESIVSSLKSMIFAKTKENAVKQEIKGIMELSRSASRAFISLCTALDFEYEQILQGKPMNQASTIGGSELEDVHGIHALRSLGEEIFSNTPIKNQLLEVLSQ